MTTDIAVRTIKAVDIFNSYGKTKGYEAIYDGTDVLISGYTDSMTGKFYDLEIVSRQWIIDTVNRWREHGWPVPQI